MVDTKSKEKESSKKLKILAKIREIKSGIEDIYNADTKTISTQEKVASSIKDFSSKTKNKLPNKDNIFDKLILDLDEILPKTNNKYVSLLRKITIESINETIPTIKPALISNTKYLFFTSDDNLNCGVNKEFPINNLSIAPEEFDLLDVLQIDPSTGLGKFVYENSIDNGFIKMNKVLYENFNGGIYQFITNNNNLFDIEWHVPTQTYNVSGMQDNLMTIDSFLINYYENIEFPNIDDILKNVVSLVNPVGGVNTFNYNFDINQNNLLGVVNKIMSVCSSPEINDLKETSLNQFNEDELDLDFYFNFTNEDDDGSDRLDKVLKFIDCNNYSQPVNQNINEDFSFLSSIKNDIGKEFDITIAKIAKDAYNNNPNIDLNAFNFSIDKKVLSTLPKALVGSIFTPKLLFPIVLTYKAIKSEIETINIKDIIKNLKSYFFAILREIFTRFLTIFWTKAKPELIKIIKEITKEIIISSTKKRVFIIRSLISILTSLLTITSIKSCDDIYDAILGLLNGLRVGGNQEIPGILLQLSKNLPGYSDKRSIINISEYLEANGIPTGDIFGEENNIIKFVSSIIKGHQQEMDENSFVQVSLDDATLPVSPVGGVAKIIPGLVKAHGKLV